MTTTTIIIVLSGIALTGLFLYVFKHSRFTEIEDKLYREGLEKWRKSITTASLVKYRGVVYHVKEIENGKLTISNHNDEYMLNVSDVWPVE